MSRRRLIALGVAAGGWLLAWIFYVPAQRTYDEGYEDGFRYGVDRGRRRGYQEAIDSQAGA